MVHATSELLVCKLYQVVFLEGPGEDSPASCTGEQRHAYIHPLVLLCIHKHSPIYTLKGAVKLNFFIASKWSTMLQNHNHFCPFSISKHFPAKNASFIATGSRKLQP